MKTLRSVLVILAVLFPLGCSQSDDDTASKNPASTSTSIVPPGPRDPCESAEAAARAVEKAWGAGDESEALRCGTPEAVDRLLAASAGDASIREFVSCGPAAPGSPVALCRFEEPGRGINLEVEPVRDGGYYVTDVTIGSAEG